MSFLDDGKEEMDCTPPFRIDPPNAAILGPAKERRRGVGVGVNGSLAQRVPPVVQVTDQSDDPRGVSRDEWLNLHASDLIRRLQAWSDQLDARESQLNARASMQDNRERQFRLQRQDAVADQAEQWRSIERSRAEIEAQARRLAFQDR